MEHSLKLETFKKAYDASLDGMVKTDFQADHHPIIYCNRAFTNMTGYNADEILGHNCRFCREMTASSPKLRICAPPSGRAVRAVPIKFNRQS